MLEQYQIGAKSRAGRPTAWLTRVSITKALEHWTCRCVFKTNTVFIKGLLRSHHIIQSHTGTTSFSKYRKITSTTC
jgi:hypothetical protein